MSVENLNSTHSVHLSESVSNYYVRDVIVLCLYALTAILSVVGNGLVCQIIFKKSSKMRSGTYILVGNLAISDLLCGLTIPASWIFCSTKALDEWGLQLPCAITKSTQVLSFYMSSLTMMLIAFERRRGILYPLKQPMKTKYWIIFTWIVCIIFVASSMGSAKIFEYFTDDRLISCRIVLRFQKPFNSDNLRKHRVWGIWMGQYFMPLFVTGLVYLTIIRHIWRRQQMGITGDALTHRESQKKKTIGMLIVVVIVFAVCWLPLHALNFTDYVVKEIERMSSRKNSRKLCNNSSLYFFLYWLGISSCVYNPFIYWWMHPDFRQGFRTMVPNIVRKYVGLSQKRPSVDSAQMNIISASVRY